MGCSTDCDHGIGGGGAGGGAGIRSNVPNHSPRQHQHQQDTQLSHRLLQQDTDCGGVLDVIRSMLHLAPLRRARPTELLQHSLFKRSETALLAAAAAAAAAAATTATTTATSNANATISTSQQVHIVFRTITIACNPTSPMVLGSQLLAMMLHLCVVNFEFMFFRTMYINLLCTYDSLNVRIPHNFYCFVSQHHHHHRRCRCATYPYDYLLERGMRVTKLDLL